MKKPLNVAQHVEILLREGVDKPELWTGGRAGETSFLLDIIKELCEQVHALDDQLDKQFEVKASG